jgi:phosphoketolase
MSAFEYVGPDDVAIRIVDSMFSQHAKWLKVTLELPDRGSRGPDG